MFLDKQTQDDEDYGVAQFTSEECIKWLDDKIKESVIYVSFGMQVSPIELQIL